jgi:thiamine-phosphate pyrophosphorylase
MRPLADGRLGMLEKTARTLGRRARRGKARSSGLRLPWLWLLTDPARTPDPIAAAARLPRGGGVIYRGFGAPDAQAMAQRLRAITRRRGLVFLVARDWRLAARVGADGVHLPEAWTRLARRLKRARPDWIVTAAAHGPRAISAAARSGADALLVSAVFDSASSTAGFPLGPVRFERLVRATKTPVIALGGVTAKTAQRLWTSRAAGLAAVGALAR